MTFSRAFFSLLERSSGFAVTRWMTLEEKLLQKRCPVRLVYSSK